MTRPVSSAKTGRLRGGTRVTVLGLALLVGFALAALGSLAFAKTHRTTLKTAHNAMVHKTIVVDSKGLTLYHLVPETTHHLLCKTSTCFTIWPPYKVSKNAKLTKATGIKGKLGKLHRHGFWQVTLGGVPLYHYSGDNGRKGSANGEGIPDPPGTWHVVKASGSAKSTHTTTTSSTSTSYSYPY
jgi:predicted lipoprotein with Yx(FWY)xxD motif